jgi:hypothetical protein
MNLLAGPSQNTIRKRIPRFSTLNPQIAAWQ